MYARYPAALCLSGLVPFVHPDRNVEVLVALATSERLCVYPSLQALPRQSAEKLTAISSRLMAAARRSRVVATGQAAVVLLVPGSSMPMGGTHLIARSVRSL